MRGSPMPGLGGLDGVAAPAAAARDGRGARLAVMLLGGAALLAIAALAALSLGSSPARAAFSGQNGRIVCDGEYAPPLPTGLSQTELAQLSRSEIFSMNPDGSDLRVLTSDLTRDGDPTVSPDGTRVAFESERDARPSDVYTMNADGTNVQRIRRAGYQGEAGWSPDGAKLVFIDAFGPSGTTTNFNISRANLDGSDLRGLTLEPSDEHAPVWSPDGSLVAFQSHRGSLRPTEGGTGVNWEIFAMDAEVGDTRFQRRLTTTAPASTDQGPAWSPDGRQLVFTSTRDGNQEVYRMNADGSGVTRLTFNATNVGGTTIDESVDAGVDWSPDGSRIVFHSNRSGDAEVYTMNASDGGNVQRLTNHQGFDGRCTWGPAPGTNPRSTIRPSVRASGVPRACASRTFRARIRAAAGFSTVRSVTVSLDGRRIRTSSTGSFTVRVPTRGLRRGTHRLTVVATDVVGNRTVRTFRFRVCAAQRRQDPRFTG